VLPLRNWRNQTRLSSPGGTGEGRSAGTSASGAVPASPGPGGALGPASSDAGVAVPASPGAGGALSASSDAGAAVPALPGAGGALSASSSHCSNGGILLRCKYNNYAKNTLSMSQGT